MRGGFNWDHHRECVEAFEAMGTNAVPYLIEQAFDFRQESAAWSNVMKVLNAVPRSWPVPHPIPSFIKTEEAASLLRDMKPPAGQLLVLMQKHLKGTNVYEHRQVLYLLGASGDGAAQAVPYLTATLKDNDIWARGLAIQSLGWIGPQAEAATPDLIELLHDKSRGTNYLGKNAVVALATIGGPKASSAIPAVKKMFEQEKNWNQRGNLGAALIKIDPTQTEVLDFLVEGVTNHQPSSERWMAASYLGRIGPAARPAVPILLKALEQTNGPLFAAITEALTNIGVAPSELLPAMKKRLNSSDDNTRFNCAMNIVRIDPANKEAQEALADLIKQHSFYERAAIDELGNAGPLAADTLPLLRKVAQESANADIRKRALRAIKRIEGPPK